MKNEPEFAVVEPEWKYIRDIICDAATACPEGFCDFCPLSDDADKQAFVEWLMRKLDQ